MKSLHEKIAGYPFPPFKVFKEKIIVINSAHFRLTRMKSIIRMYDIADNKYKLIRSSIKYQNNQLKNEKFRRKNR
jgi:hypothetical protein